MLISSIRYKCCKPLPKCYCCPPRDPPPDCVDTGCNSTYNGQGRCVDVIKADWNLLDQFIDLTESTPTHAASPSLCSSNSDNCCRCFKEKTCQDSGCNEIFNGQGVCIDVSNGDLSQLKDVDLTTKQDPKLGLCENKFNDNCCSCFKKKGSLADSDCFKESVTFNS